jgi:hypothetical protein
MLGDNKLQIGGKVEDLPGTRRRGGFVRKPEAAVGAVLGRVDLNLIRSGNAAESVSFVSGLPAALLVALGLASPLGEAQVPRRRLGRGLAVLVEPHLEREDSCLQFGDARLLLGDAGTLPQSDLDPGTLIQSSELLARQHIGYTISRPPPRTG